MEFDTAIFASQDFAYEAYRLLMGVDMRRFAPQGDWTKDTMAYASGALDFSLRLLPKSGAAFAAEDANESLRTRIGGVPFWDLARASAHAVRLWIEKGYAAESNAGLYGLGPKDGRYGRLRLQKIYFGISAAISGSLVSASCLTVNGDLLVTAVSAAPLVNRSHLETFSDSMIGSLTIAAMQKKPLSRKGTPLVDNPLDPRGGLPWKGTLQCPEYEELKSYSMPAFDVDKYVGVWYELAFHDITQCNGCGCTQFNMTRHGNVIEDMFTVTCPWPWTKGVDGPWLPGYNVKLDQQE
eukprot:s1118_g16.t1